MTELPARSAFFSRDATYTPARFVFTIAVFLRSLPENIPFLHFFSISFLFLSLLIHSAGQKSSIHLQNRSGYKTGRLRRQENCATYQFLHPAKPFHGRAY
jgi:hypothetical protein